MKKILLLITILTIIFSLIGCVESNNQSNDKVDEGLLTVEEFEKQPISRGNAWNNDWSLNTRCKIYIKIQMYEGTIIKFTADTDVYKWGVIETLSKYYPGSYYVDSGWNNTWTSSNVEYVTHEYETAYIILTIAHVNDTVLTSDEIDEIHSMFEIEGYKLETELEEEYEMKGINHRGWYLAPENTLSAYRESYNNGFKYVECDVQFTSDGVAVLLHDDTIDRTSNGTGKISEMTYAEASQYDYSYDDKDLVNDFSLYRGEKIPTFDEFIKLCKELGLHPYIEIKGNVYSTQAKQLVEIVRNNDMLDNVSWISFSGDALILIVKYCETARIGWVLTDTNASKIAANNINIINSKLYTGKNEVFIDIYYTLVTQELVDLCEENYIALEVWTVNSELDILSLHPYVSGVSSDTCNAEEILK